MRSAGRERRRDGAVADWDFLGVVVIVPLVEMFETTCGLCGRTMRADSRGNLYTGPNDCRAVCDACGQLQAPTLMTLCDRLRAAWPITVAIGGAQRSEDPYASYCPVCYTAHVMPSEPGWHFVDPDYGRPVCPPCATRLPTDLHGLRATLQGHTDHIAVWRRTPRASLACQ